MRKEKFHQEEDFSRADHVGVYIMLRNKLKTIRSYNNKKAFKRLKTPGDFLDAVRQFESESERKKNAAEKAAGLWFMEGLIREARNFDNGSFLLIEPAIERFKPILHVGWGMDVLSETGFDFHRFMEVINYSADTKYKLLAMEPIGVIYMASQQPLRSFLIGINIPPFPDHKSLSLFFSNFNVEETRMISHGFGRGAYFQANSLCAALRKSMDCPAFFDPFYSIRGTAFAFTMVNSTHLARVFLTADKLTSSNFGNKRARFFHDGVISALSFLEWNLPGLLETLEECNYTRKAMETVHGYRNTGGVYSL
jgi:hypothetical protein